MIQLERRLAQLIAAGIMFTADDVTDNGRITLDPGHEANSVNNGIGGLINFASRHGRIEWTGQVVRSRAPHRKGGSIRVWRGTVTGARWADQILGDRLL